MLRLEQTRENAEGDEMDDCIVTDVGKLEEDMWKTDSDDDFCEDFQTPRDNDEEDTADLLNDEEIEEIMIFQTQSLQRKRSESLEESQRNQPSLDKQQTDILETGLMWTYIQSKSDEDISQDDSSPPTSQESEKKSQALNDDNLSRITVEEGNSIEESNASRNLLEEDNLSRCPVAEIGNMSSDNTEKGEKFEVNMSCVKENIIEEDVITKKEHLTSRKESREQKLLHDYCASSEFDENQLSLRASGIERSADGEPISDSDDVEVQPEDHVHGRSQMCIRKGGLAQTCDVNEESPLPEKTVEMDCAECTDIYNVSADLLNDGNEADYEDVPDDIPDNSCNGRETLSVPEGQERWEKEHFQGPPGELTLSDNGESEDNMEEMVANESITLISDNEEQVCCCCVFNTRN